MTKEERIKIINKAKKLKGLADRGVGGEKEVAKQALDKYIKEHNITVIEMDEERISIDEFEINSIKYISNNNGYLREIFWSYKTKEFKIKTIGIDFINIISFNNYADFFRAVRISDNGKIKTI